MTTPFNKPFIVGHELEYIREAVDRGKLTGDGHFTRLCQNYFQERYGFSKCLLTTSCTDALEMSAILAQIGPGDEVIVPSYTFVSTANAFVLRGAEIRFADSLAEEPNLDVSKLEGLVNEKTKAIVVVHYAGVAVDMDPVMALAEKHGLVVIEDAAQAVESTYKGRPLGGIGHFGAFSFHETKNIISGEGGLLAVNDPERIARAEVIWEKGTNRAAFFRGEVDKYNWVDIGSSFLPSELTAAFLWAQLEHLEKIQARRKAIWQVYQEELAALGEAGLVGLPYIPEYATNNAHMYYLLTADLQERSALIAALKESGFHAVFHYQALHDSPFFEGKHDGRSLPEARKYTDRLVRLPLFYELETGTVRKLQKPSADTMVDNPMQDLEFWLGGRDPESSEFPEVVLDVWASELGPEEKLRLSLKIFEEHPSYGAMMFLWIEVIRAVNDPRALARLALEAYSGYLTGEDEALAEATEASLYYDLFEHPELGPLAWEILIDNDPSEDLLNLILKNSGPLPWSVKYAKLLELSADKRHHHAIYLAIRNALFDAMGQVDEQQAADLFAALELDPFLEEIAEPKGYPTLAQVRERLP